MINDIPSRIVRELICIHTFKAFGRYTLTYSEGTGFISAPVLMMPIYPHV